MTTAGRDMTADVATSMPLVEAKFHPMKPRAGTIDRPRLVKLLMDEAGLPVTALIAPPGYGKTTLLAQWVAAEPRPVAWLTLDDLDNDPAVLLTYLAEALGRIGPVSVSSPSWHARGGQRLLATVVPRLASEIHRWGRPAVLVLDDAHRLVDQQCLDALTGLLDHLPPGFRVAIAGRLVPELPFARFRAQGALQEIGPELLALDEAETAELAAAAGCRLGRDEAAALTLRTEGWAAGVYLATLARVRGSQDVGAVGTVSGSDRYIAAYLHSEVDSGLGESDVTLLTRTSVLETITPVAAEALAGMPDAGERMRALARRSLLIHEMDRTGSSWRYHHLLREYLLGELERREPGATRDLHRRAAAWFASVDDYDRAIEHAMLARDNDTAAAYVVSVALATHYRGHTGTLFRWLRGFDLAAFEHHPPLASIAAWIFLLTGRADDADLMADLVERASFEGRPGDGSASFESARALLRTAMARSGPKDVLTNATFAVSREPADSPWRPIALQATGYAHALLGQHDEADAWLEQAVTTGRSTAFATAMLSLAKRASIAIRRGDWEAAQAHIRESRKFQVERGYEDVLSSLLVYAVAARIAIQRGDVSGAKAELVRAQLVRPLANHAAPWLSVDALLELTRAYLAVADPAGAQAVLREAEAIVRRRPALGTLTTELIEVRRLLAGASTTLAGSSTLTSAELRVLPLLPTYLSFQDIADRLMISRNTVKTHAMSIYGKLWASSRGEAVERAVELGLLEPYPGLEPARPHLSLDDPDRPSTGPER